MRRIGLFNIVCIFIFISGCKLFDRETPIINGTEKINLVYELGSPVPNWLEGITAIDQVDGDLTAFIQVDTNVDMTKEGIYKVGYMVSDKSGNRAYQFIHINVMDSSMPSISGFSNLITDLHSQTKPDWFKNIVGRDSRDGNLTNQITVDDSQVNYDIPGDYPVYYNLLDSNGNSIQVEITLSVLEIGSRLNPVQYGESFVVKGNDPFFGEYELELKVNGIKRGDEAETIVIESNNEPSNDLQEYLITNLTVKLLKIDETNSYYKQKGFANWNQFRLIPTEGGTYSTKTSAIIPNQLKECNLYLGESCTGNLVFIVDVGDQFILKYDKNWFKLSTDFLPIIPPEQIVGYSLDVVQSDYADYKDIKYNAPIFDENWLETLEITKWGGNSSVHRSTTSTDLLRFEPEQYDVGLSSYSNDFILLKNIYDFPLWMKTESNDYSSNFFIASSVQYTFARYFVIIDSYYYNFKEILHPEFLKTLEDLKQNKMSYEDFFSLYGTHVIKEGFFGASIDVRCGVLSNHSNKTIQSTCNQLVSSHLTNSFSDNTNLNSKTYISFHTLGGNFVFNGIDQYSTDRSSWIQSFDGGNGMTLVDFGDNGLVPIWEYFPEEYEQLIAPMKEKFTEYYEREYHK